MGDGLKVLLSVLSTGVVVQGIIQLNLSNKLIELEESQARLEQSYSTFTNQYAHAHATTNSQTNDATRISTRSPLTPGAVEAIRYAEELNSRQATPLQGPR
jgi:hypothetical protein